MKAPAGLPHFTLEVGACEIAAIPDARLRELAAYWFARCPAPGAVPPRSAIDPLDFPDLLPNVMMLDCVASHRAGDAVSDDGGLRYRFRLAGEAVTYAAGRRLAGHFLDEVLPEGYRDYVMLLNRVAIDQRRPVYSASLFHDEGNVVNGLTYRLVMPLYRPPDGAAHTQADRAPNAIFVCQFWQKRADGGWWDGDWLQIKPEIHVVAPPAFRWR
jgi:hypothetical protein